MNRIDQKFTQLKEAKRKAFISFVTAGDPNLEVTHDLVLAFEKSGVDIIEIGVPFSDPLADGPTIQASSFRSLQQGTTLVKVLQCVKKLRQQTEIPIALMMYYNPIFHYGEEKFVKDAVDCGVDGVIVPDLPPEEAVHLIKFARKVDLATIFFISPTTTKERMKIIAKASTGFIYYVSIAGITGARHHVAQSYVEQIKQAKEFTEKPICVGFGVSTPQQVKDISKVADGVIVGSAIVNEIVKNTGNKNLVKNVARFVSILSKPCCISKN